MKAMVAVLVAVPLVCFAGGWRQVDSGTTEDLRGVAVLDEMTAVAVGLNGTILRSTDGGEMWVAIDGLETSWNLWSVSFPDAIHGTAVGYVTGLNQGLILRTDDGGLTWRRQESNAQPLTGVYFVDAYTGTAVGQQTILRTSDGGDEWVRPNAVGKCLPNSVFFTDASHGSAAAVRWPPLGGPVACLLETNDGGSTWERRYGGDVGILNGVAFAERMRGTAVGLLNPHGAGIMVRTTDGGDTWHRQRYIFCGGPFGWGVLSSVAFFGEVGVAVGRRVTLWTNDGGDSWQLVCDGPALSFVAFFAQDRVVAVGARGVIALSP